MLISRFLDCLCGSCVFICEENAKTKIADQCLKKGLVFRNLYVDKENRTCIETDLSKRLKTADLLDKAGINVYDIKGKGFPHFIKKYRMRAGFFAGLLLFAFVVFFSRNYVWNIEVKGNNHIRDDEVIKLFDEYGLHLGTYIPSVDLYTLCNTVIEKSEDFSWVSVNLDGTKAMIEVRERKQKPEKDGIKASNLVAKYAGQIQSTTVYSGKTVVEKDQVVGEGELLVSGMLEKKYGFDIVRSSGNVYAYVTRNLEVKVPFESEEKTPNGNYGEKLTFELFGRKFSFKDNLDTVSGEYVDETDRKRVVLFDEIVLPVYVEKTVRRETYKTKNVISEDEAKRIAQRKMETLIKEELADDEILEQTFEEEKDEKEYKLVCKAYVLADIAEEKEIKTDKKG